MATLIDGPIHFTLVGSIRNSTSVERKFFLPNIDVKNHFLGIDNAPTCMSNRAMLPFHSYRPTILRQLTVHSVKREVNINTKLVW